MIESEKENKNFNACDNVKREKVVQERTEKTSKVKKWNDLTI